MTITIQNRPSFWGHKCYTVSEALLDTWPFPTLFPQFHLTHNAIL